MEGFCRRFLVNDGGIERQACAGNQILGLGKHAARHQRHISHTAGDRHLDRVTHLTASASFGILLDDLARLIRRGNRTLHHGEGEPVGRQNRLRVLSGLIDQIGYAQARRTLGNGQHHHVALAERRILLGGLHYHNTCGNIGMVDFHHLRLQSGAGDGSLGLRDFAAHIGLHRGGIHHLLIDRRGTQIQAVNHHQRNHRGHDPPARIARL